VSRSESVETSERRSIMGHFGVGPAHSKRCAAAKKSSGFGELPQRRGAESNARPVAPHCESQRCVAFHSESLANSGGRPLAARAATYAPGSLLLRLDGGVVPLPDCPRPEASGRVRGD